MKKTGGYGPLVLSFLVLLPAGGCYSMMDVLGTKTTSQEEREAENDTLQDDRIEDKHPVYDPDRKVQEEFDGCKVVLNKSATVTKLDIGAPADLGEDLEDAAEGFYHRKSEAMEALAGADLIPSLETVNGFLKVINDGVYAAIEVGTEEGAYGMPSKRQFLFDLAAKLDEARQAASGQAADYVEAALVHVTAALLAAGLDVSSLNLEPAVLAAAQDRASEFLRQPIFATPIGFYTWSEVLQQVFVHDRFLQNNLSVTQAGAGPSLEEFGMFGAMAAVLSENQDLLDAYEKFLALYKGLTNPYSSYSVADLMPYFPDLSALDSVDSARSRFLAEHGDPFVCRGTYLALLPHSRGKDTDFFSERHCGQDAVPEGVNLLDELIEAIRNGDLDLEPGEDSGWYDYQVYALETLLVPEKGLEKDHLFLTAAYKKKLVETFKTLITQIRETHVKQLEMSGGVTAAPQDRPFDIYPKFPAEPFPTFYLRTARAYRFVRAYLATVLGPQFLDEVHSLREGAVPADRTLSEELDRATWLCYGLYSLTAKALGMDPTEPLLSEETDEFPLEAAETHAASWLATWKADPDVLADTRVAVPVRVDPLTDEAIWWAVVGVKPVVVHASFYPGYEPRDIHPEDFCEFREFVDHFYVLLVEPTVEVRRPLGAEPLSREQLRAISDAHDSVEDIQHALEAE